MKAGYPFRKYTRALRFVSMMLIVWGIWCYVQTEPGCDYLGETTVVHAQEALDTPSIIKNVEVTQQEQDSLVTITGSKPLTYTVVKLSDPSRILVDVPGFTTEQDMDAIQVDGDAINEITTKQIEKGERKFCRIAIALKKDVEYDVTAKDSDLLIRIAQSAPKAVETARVVPDKREDTVVQSLKVPTITDLKISEDPPLVTIVADSMLDSYKAFQLDDPTRMVVDVPGVREALKDKQYTVESAFLEKIKVGQHHDKVRFVLYFKDKLPTYKIDKNDTKLYVRLSVSADEMMTVAKNGNEKTPTAKNERKVLAQEEKEYTGQKISLDFKDADIRNILRLIADVSALNIIVSDSVDGKVTIKLDNVPWDEVLDIILETNNLGKIWTKSVMRIETQAQIRKISDDQYRARKSLEKVADLETVVIDIIYRDATDIHNLLNEEKELTSERGALTVDPNLNRIVVTDTPDIIETIRKRIARYDDTTVRQVFIDAKIVQSIPTHTKEIGIQWGGPYTTTANGDTIIGVAGAQGVEFERSEVTDPTTGLVTEMVEVIGGNMIDLPAAVGLGAGGGIGFGILKDNLELTATLTAMEKDEKLKIISSPRVMSIDKNEAMIKQGVALPYLKLSEEGVTSTEFKDAVLELKVTPTILSEKIIKIEIRVKKDQKSAQTGAGGEPGIDVREAQTVLMVESGRTVVIGGIYEEGTQTIMSGVPFFSGIPGIGRLFRNDYSKKELTELLIFVTTTIVPKEIVGSDV
jgi:type IV pilus assembly protein PilQ